MGIGFDNIIDHIIPIDDFVLKWRFTDANYNQLPQPHLNQLKPLDKGASNFLWDFIAKSNLHAEVPFKKGFFKKVDAIDDLEGNEDKVREWILNHGFPVDKDVYLSWRPDAAMIVPWELLAKYFDDFNYADDLTVVDSSLNWALLFFHEGRIYFGSNMDSESNPNLL